MKNVLRYFDVNVSREDIFKPTIANESLREISNDNGVKVVNFAASKILIVKSTLFPRCDIHTFIWTSLEGTDSTIKLSIL
jgi:hypothetical protein